LFFAPGHPARVVYVKTHLFDVDVEGAPPVRESDHFVGGGGPATVELKGWKFGLSICYDLRFAELYLKYAEAVDVILIPSAFLVPTGQAHWHVLVRARAIENQCFVAAPAQSGEHTSVASGPSRRTFGHSLVVDPWGAVLLDMEHAPGAAVVELKRDLIEKARRQIPMQGHRRLR
jgi:predicted amidohydrolase